MRDGLFVFYVQSVKSFITLRWWGGGGGEPKCEASLSTEHEAERCS